MFFADVFRGTTCLRQQARLIAKSRVNCSFNRNWSRRKKANGSRELKRVETQWRRAVLSENQAQKVAFFDAMNRTLKKEGNLTPHSKQSFRRAVVAITVSFR